MASATHRPMSASHAGTPFHVRAPAALPDAAPADADVLPSGGGSEATAEPALLAAMIVRNDTKSILIFSKNRFLVTQPWAHSPLPVRLPRTVYCHYRTGVSDSRSAASPPWWLAIPIPPRPPFR